MNMLLTVLLVGSIISPKVMIMNEAVFYQSNQIRNSENGNTISSIQDLYKEGAQRVSDADIELYGEKIDEIIVLYDKDRGIDLLGVGLNRTFADRNMDIIPVFARNYSSIYGDCFTNVSWISREGVWSLSITHTFDGLFFNGGHTGQKAFEVLAYFKAGIDRWPSSSTNSMRNQFQCHVDIARQFKNPYNIEPSRADKGYAGFVLYGRN